jgi:hypothetical protein
MHLLPLKGPPEVIIPKLSLQELRQLRTLHIPPDNHQAPVANMPLLQTFSKPLKVIITPRVLLQKLMELRTLDTPPDNPRAIILHLPIQTFNPPEAITPRLLSHQLHQLRTLDTLPENHQ